MRLGSRQASLRKVRTAKFKPAVRALLICEHVSDTAPPPHTHAFDSAPVVSSVTQTNSIDAWRAPLKLIDRRS